MEAYEDRPEDEMSEADDREMQRLIGLYRQELQRWETRNGNAPQTDAASMLIFPKIAIADFVLTMLGIPTGPLRV